jgi:hypothetical protein
MRSRVHRRYVKAPRRNPPIITEVLEFAVPGFGGFAASRFLTHVTATQVAKRAPSWAKHAGVIASLGSFGAAWLLANKVKFLEKYHVPIVVGSAIAAAQSILQLYLPMVGWMVSDATPEIATAATPQVSAADQQLAQMQLQPTNEDPNEFMYNDAFDAGRYSGSQGRASMKTGPLPQTTPAAGQPAQAQSTDDLAIDDAIGQANLGVFAN